ncbi:PREDICTED: uncharacterized protein LOC104608346 [Nelumbo nucifera]|uniref:Uncharacterized protein LOC104608346 n=2 Tax=Nelumbo nucifera TaxID=4432 RepID=A0A1U8B0L5_NELNU|nr:PREDICTED: uncharacterized protein LOC104608346 [Nelumbo nucifera]DAD48066.1 TPA_asm: hypothetical protein HUJ06_018003 [Nelumbo nucifera]
MGREWYWGRSTKRGGDKESPGCMSAVLQFFDFHQFPSTLQQTSLKVEPFLHEDLSTVVKGVEAPRNSLESEKGVFVSSASLSSIKKEEEEEDLNIPMAGIRVEIKQRTSGREAGNAAKARKEELSSESSTPPGIKTPNLVARLMGLDILPDSFSPCSSSSTHVRSRSFGRVYHHHHLQERNACAAVKRDIRSRRALQSRTNFMDCSCEVTGTRSLPDTPRISAARRSDVDPRFSLQINKENLLSTEEFGDYFGRVSRDSLPCSPYSSSKLIKLRRREWRQDDENRSPSNYAREIVKQVKENARRRVGLVDITNTTRIIAGEGDEALAITKSKKTRRFTLAKQGDESSPSPGKNSSTMACSPRLRFLETKSKPVMAASASSHHQASSHSPRPPRPISVISPPSPPPQTTALSPLSSSTSACGDNQSQPKAPSSKTAKLNALQQQQQQKQEQTAKKCKKASAERFTQRLKKPPQTTETIRNVREEAFVRAAPSNKASISDKKTKKTPLSNDFVNIAVPSSFVPLKKEQPPPSQTPGVQIAHDSKRCSQLSSGSSRTYEARQTQTLVHHDGKNSGSSNGGHAEFEYVSRILKCTGIDGDTMVPFTRSRWFSPSHPLDPSIFHHLERSFVEDPNNTLTLIRGGNGAVSASSGSLSHRWNRKLLFHVVDEILTEVLRPYLSKKPWLSCVGNRGCSGCSSSPLIKMNQQMVMMNGSQLMDEIWWRIRSFPCANCQVLQDIDALIEKDLPDTNVRTVLPFSEEGESIVFEIERDILDSLVHETAAVCLALSAAHEHEAASPPIPS